jgi:hypothetical protein
MAGPNEQTEPVKFLEIENGLDETISMKFHGDLYEWAPGEKLRCTEEAARHIFGYSLEDKSSAFMRMGWLNTRPDCQPKDAMKKLSKIKFRPVQQVFEMSQAKTRRGKTASVSDRSLTDVRDQDGAVDADPTSPGPPEGEAEAF